MPLEPAPAPPPPAATSPHPGPGPLRTELALRLIILEKLAKACLVLVAGLAFLTMLVTGSSAHLHGMATHLREHVTSAWSVYLADEVVSVTERRHLAVATAALFLDGAMTGAEWYALSRGKTWGEWLVVGAMSLLLPFEIAALLREVHAGRVVVLVGNLGVVAYLAHHAWVRHRRPTAGA